MCAGADSIIITFLTPYAMLRAVFNTMSNVGTVAPDFALEELDGGCSIRLNDLSARNIVVMEFGSYS
jgi:hypothetical protein